MPTRTSSPREGYEVDVATDMENAQALLTDRAYGGVVIDLSLGPGKETLGLELVRRVRERDPDTAEFPRIAP